MFGSEVNSVRDYAPVTKVVLLDIVSEVYVVAPAELEHSLREQLSG